MPNNASYSLRRYAALLALLVASAAPVHAEPLWELGLGAAALARPDYPGADEESLYLLPFPYVIYRGERLQADDRGVKGLLLRSDTVELDISGGGALPVNSKDNRARDGMPDLDPAFELGPSLRIKLQQSSDRQLAVELKVRALLSVDAPSAHCQGWVANPELRWDRHWGDDLRVAATVEAFYGNRGYHGYFHDVDASFANVERPAYRANRGYGGSQLALYLYHNPSRDWRLRWQLSYLDLQQASFDDGPLFRRQYGVYASLVVSRILWKSSRQVD